MAHKRLLFRSEARDAPVSVLLVRGAGSEDEK
jgi:hypothetical protein